MNDVMKNPFDAEFEVENDWKKDQHQQQSRDRLSSLNTKNGHVPTAPSQLLPSPASSTTTSSYVQRGDSQQDVQETPGIFSATCSFSNYRSLLSDDPPAPIDIKRVTFLERNRVAAFKCRAKKKEWTTELEERARGLKTSKDQHTIAIASLESELIYLKNEVLRHSDCSDAMHKGGKTYIPANLDSNLDSNLGGLSNDTVGIVDSTGNESCPLPMTTEDDATQGIALQADNDDDDDDGDFVDDADDYDYSSMHAISNAELETLLTKRIAQDESGGIR
ncbi:hypothetical protein MMC32_003533 [Xylographa parallela]|nr:hypothetical protein [Xylographa parallela]